MKTKFEIVGIVVLALLFLGGVAIASEARHASISNIRGDVLVRQSGEDWQQAQVGMILHKDDEIKTSDEAQAEILLDDGQVGSVQVSPKSLFKFDTMDVDPQTGDKFTLLNLAVGKVLVHAEKLQGDSKFEVKTPTSTTGVRGTMFEVSVE